MLWLCQVRKEDLMKIPEHVWKEVIFNRDGVVIWWRDGWAHVDVEVALLIVRGDRTGIMGFEMDCWGTRVN